MDATFTAWGRGVTRPAIVLPTGAGKTFVFAHVAARHVAEVPSDAPCRVVVLVDRDELAHQTVRELHSVAPHLDIGVVKATQNDVHAPVIVASIQTLARKSRREQLRDVGLVIVDECHGALARTYLDVLEHFGCFSSTSGTLTLGVTATMARTDGHALGQVWQEIVYEKDLLWMIRHGYLVDVDGVTVTVDDMNMRDVRTSAGDYRPGDLGTAFEESSAAEVITKWYVEHGGDRPGVVFTPTVATAHALAEVLSGAGVSARGVDGSMRKERGEVMRGFDRGDFQVLTNCAIAKQGWDSPRAEVVVMARNTQSSVFYIQAVGRGLRKYAAKPNKRCTVVDVVGVSARHSLVGINTLGGFALADGETLQEAADRVERELDEIDEAEVTRRAVHRVAVEAADLFHGSRFVWNHTVGGVPFISAGDNYIILVPEIDGGYAVARLPKKIGYESSEWIQRDVADMSYAMVWGEECAETVGSAVLTQRERAWRKKPATQKARGLAERLRIVVPEKVNGGDLADQIDRVFATRRIDKFVLLYLKQIGVKL